MRIPLLILCILWSFFSVAQNKRAIDSLNSEISKTDSDSSRAKLLNILFYEYIGHDIKKARETATEQLDISSRGNYLRGMHNGLRNLGHVYQQEGSYPEALDYFLRSLKLSLEIKNGIGTAYSNVAAVYTILRDYDKALEYNFFSLDHMRKSVDTSRQDAKLYMSGLYNNIGIVYFNKKDHNTALAYHLAGLQKGVDAGDLACQALSNNCIGQVYFYLKRYGQALEYYNRSLKLATESGSLQDIAEANIYTGILHDSTGMHALAIKCYENALTTTYQTGNRPQRLTIYQNLIHAYEGLGDYKSKARFLEKFITLNDSILSDEKLAQMALMKTKFESEEKDKENQILASRNKIQQLELSQRNYILMGLALLLVLTIAVGLLYIRQNKALAEQRAIQLEQKLLRSQMNPHFIFNSLTTIESFIYENNPKEAGKYLSDFAKLMRLILENSAEEYITLEKEISTLEYYLVLQKLRLENKLDYKIIRSKNIEPSDIKIPPMLTQPFIENAIEHGFRGSKETGEIRIAFKLENDTLTVEVADNGIGIKKAGQTTHREGEHRSMALQITKERLAALNMSKKKKLSFSITDISDENSKLTGTKVTFSIPLV